MGLLSTLGGLLGGGGKVVEGVTDVMVEKEGTKQVEAKATSLWRPIIALSTGVTMFTYHLGTYWLTKKTFDVYKELGFIAESGSWQYYVPAGSSLPLDMLWQRWDALGVLTYGFGGLYLTGYAGVRGGEKILRMINEVNPKAIKTAKAAIQRKIKRPAPAKINESPAQNLENPIENTVDLGADPVTSKEKRLAAELDEYPNLFNEEDYTAPEPQTLGPTIYNKNYAWGPRSLERMEGVNPAIIKLITVALTKYSKFDVGIAWMGGLRDELGQLSLMKTGATTITNSRHLYGYALDIICYDENGKITRDWKYYELFYLAVKAAAAELNMEFVWGGNWSTKDGPHFQLTHAQYPDFPLPKRDTPLVYV